MTDGEDTWIVNADGSNDHRLIEGCTDPAWATTGEILCDGSVNGQSGAFTIRPDGTGLRLLHPRRPRTGERGYFWMRSP